MNRLFAGTDAMPGGRSITFVFAHPDDETYATGATIAKYAAAGGRCSLYCATDGDAGKSSGIPVSSPEALGQLRRAELRAACDILGIGTIVNGGVADGQLAQADPERVLAWIIHLIRSERPDVVVTFGPEGAPTEHPDHKAISRLATAAYLLAGTTAYGRQMLNGALPHRPSRLCYVTWPEDQPMNEAHAETEPQPVHIGIDARPWNATKRAAFAAHATQQQHRESFERFAMAERECFFVMTGTPSTPAASDLFAAL